MKSVRELCTIIEELMDDSFIENEGNLAARITAECHRFMLENPDIDPDEEDFEDEENSLQKSLTKIMEKAGYDSDDSYDFIQEVIYLVQEELEDN